MWEWLFPEHNQTCSYLTNVKWFTNAFLHKTIELEKKLIGYNPTRIKWICSVLVWFKFVNLFLPFDFKNHYASQGPTFLNNFCWLESLGSSLPADFQELRFPRKYKIKSLNKTMRISNTGKKSYLSPSPLMLFSTLNWQHPYQMSCKRKSSKRCYLPCHVYLG